MMSDHRRRRSPESSRRRRKARRDSREQLAAEAAASSGMPLLEPSTYQPEPITMRHDPSSIAARSRKYSSSDLSSSSSSYLDISRKYPKNKRYGGILKSFFSTPSEHKHHYRRKKKRRIFGFGNSSSSSVNSDLAYGTGFIKKSKSRGALSPQETIHGPAHNNDGRRSQPRREKTDEEIIEIGRKLAKIASDQNAQDLAASGRRKPTSFETAVTGFDKFRRHNTGDSLSRGIGPSRPHGDSSPDDSEWESASEDEFSDDADSGLAYGASASALSLVANQPQRKPSQIVSQKPPEEIRPPDRKSSVVDPKMFGPVNSLRGYVRTPCGFDKEQPPVPNKRYSESMAPITPVDSASIEARPLQTVFAVPTSDPRRFDAARGSVASSRPDPVPIQAPKPIAPVPQRLYEEERIKDLDRRDPKPSRRQSDGESFAETAAAAALGATAVAMMERKDKRTKRDKHDERDSERRDSDREREKRRQRELELEREIARREAELREREERYAREKESHRRSKRDSNVKIIDERDQKRSSRDDRRDDRSDKRSETDKRSERRDADVDVEYEREKRRREREKKRDEPTGGYDRDKRRIKDDRKDDHRESRKEERQDARRVSQPSEQPALEYRRVEDPNFPASKAPIDPFQFQVDDDAFQTPLYSTTPMRPLTPQVVTVEREPDFSRFDDMSIDDGRKSRRDSFEEEMRDAKHIYDESSHTTAPIDAAAMAAAVAVVEREQREHKRGRDPEPRSPKDPSQKEDAQAEADRYYAELRTARRIAEEKIRSRSNSPDKSVVEKYNKDEPEEPIIRIVTPPEMENKEKNKSKYDGPNADVRIDNVIVPRDLPKFRQPPVSPDGPHLPVVLFKSRDPSAERERPLLNLVLPTPVPTPTPEKQKKEPVIVEQEPAAKEPEPEKTRTRDVSIGPRGEIIESPSTPKSVTWGKNETKRYYPESPEHSRERSPDDHEPKVVEVAKSPRPAKKSGGWGMIAAAIVGAGGAAAAGSDEESVGPKNEVREPEKDIAKPADSEQQGSPKQRTVLPKGTTPKALDEEPADLPPAPGPKPASPRSSQMPGTFADDLDFAARLAGGLEKSGFDPNIVIDNDTYRRRDSPPGSNDDYPLYKRPFAETVSDLGVYGADGSSTSKSAAQQELALGDTADTQDKEEKTPADEFDIPSKTSKKERRKQEKASRRRSGDDYKDIEVIEEPEESVKSIAEPEPEPTFEPVKLSKKEQRKRDKAAKAAQWADEEPSPLTQEPESIEPSNAGEDEWAETPSKKSKKSKKSKRSSSNWDEEEPTPTDDRRISVPVDAFKDLQDDKAANPEEEWDTPKKSKKKSKRDSVTYDSPSRSESIAPSEASTGSSRDKSKKSSRRKSGQDYESSSRGYDIPEDEPPDKRERKRDSYKPIDRDVSSVVSDPAARYDDRYDSKSVASRDDDEMGSVVSAPTGSEPRRKSSKSDKRSSKEEKRSSGSFFGLFGKSNGTEEKEKESSKSSKDGKKEQSFLDNAGTLGAGAGLAGAVAAYLSRSNATDTPSEKETSDIDLEPTQKQIARSREVDFVDPEIIQRVIKPAIDPQYGDLLPLPPSEPGSPHWEAETLPALPDSRPNTPPEQERALLRDKLHTHVRRRSAFDTPVKSPSHTAIPIQFRIGQRSVPSSPGVIRSSPIPSMPSPSTPAIELGSVPSKRPSRPTSWDSSREIKPLYLLEQAGRSSSHVPDDDLDSMDLPPLPPSRESPGPEYDVRQDDVEYFRLAPSERDAPPLHIDTSVEPVLQSDDHLGSQDSTPKAEKAPPLEQQLGPHTLGSESEDAFEDAEEHIQRSMSPSPTPHEQTADDLPTLPRQPQGDTSTALTPPEAGRPWDAIESHDTPAPVDPVSKDRSSYLLRSTPRSAGGDVIERSSPPSPSPKTVVEPKFSHDNLALDAALGAAAGGLVAAAMLHSDDATSQGVLAPVQAVGESESSQGLPSMPKDLSQEELQPVKETDLPLEPSASVGIDKVPWTESEPQELSFTPAKKGKKGKKGRKDQLEEFELPVSNTEDLSESITTLTEKSQPIEVTTDDWDVPKTSKKGKKKKKSQFEDWEAQSDAPQTQDTSRAIDDLPAAQPISEAAQEPVKDEDAQGTPTLERSSSTSKKGKKKKGKKFSSWEPEDEPPQNEPSSQSTSGDVPPVNMEVEQNLAAAGPTTSFLDDSVAPDEFAPALSKKDKKKKKGKKAQAWEPEDEISQQPSRTMSPEPIKHLVEADSGTGEASRDLDLAPDQLSRSEGAVRSGESELDELPTSSKPTPAGGPGAWVPTPASAEPKPSEAGYFPSAPTVHRPSVSEASRVDDKKGYFPSALSMLPMTAPLAAVGSLFGRGKRDKKDSESGDIDSDGVTGQPSVERTLDESQIAPLQTVHSSDQLTALPTAHVLVEQGGAGADMALGGSLSEDKSVGDTPSSAVGTTDLLPDEQLTAPEATERWVAQHQPPQPISSDGSIFYEEQPASPTSRDIHVDDILPIPSGEDEDNMEPIIEEPSNVAGGQPMGTIDWEQEAGSKKKGKKGKKNRKSIQDDSQLPIASESSLPPSTDTTRIDTARNEAASTSVDEVQSLAGTDAAADITPSESSFMGYSPSSKPGRKSLKKSKRRMDSAELVPWEDDIPQDAGDRPKSAEMPTQTSTPNPELASTTSEGGSQKLPGTPPSGKKPKKEKKRLRASRTMSLSDDMATDSADDPSTHAASIDTENLNWDGLKPSRLTVFSDVGVNDDDQSEADWDVPRKGQKGKQVQDIQQQAAEDSAALSESAQSGQASKESAGDSAAQDTESQGLEEFQFTPKKGKASKKKRQSVTWADSREESPLGTSRLDTRDLPQPEVKELSPISPVRKDVLFPEVEGSQDQFAAPAQPSSSVEPEISSSISPAAAVEKPTAAPVLLEISKELEHQTPLPPSDPTSVPAESHDIQDSSILPGSSLDKDLAVSDVAPESDSALVTEGLSQEPIIPPADKSMPSESIQPSADEISRDLPAQDTAEASTAVAVAEDEFPMTTKKSKKDKKKRKSKIQDELDWSSQETTKEPIIEPSAQENLTETPAESSGMIEESGVQPSLTSEPEPVASQKEPEEEPFDSFVSSKKSKKDKKKRKSKIQDDFDIPAETVTPIEETSLPSAPSDNVAGDVTETPVVSQEETTPAITTSEVEQAAEQNAVVDDDFAWAPTTKKSKKDKKKGKSKVQDEFFDAPSETGTPVEGTSAPSLPSDQAIPSSTEGPTVSEEHPSLSKDNIEPQDSMPVNLTSEPEQVAEQEAPVDDDFSWAPTTKKSKKDKKKRKSKIQDDFVETPETATPIEESSAPLDSNQDLIESNEAPQVTEESSVSAKEAEETAQDDGAREKLPLEPEQQTVGQEPVPEDAFYWAPTSKKSKKDKKRKGKVQDDFFSSPAETATATEESNAPTDPSQDLAQPSEAPVTGEDMPASPKDIDESTPTNLASEPEQQTLELEPVEDDLSWAPKSKKSKKDKKRKSKVQDDTFDLPSETATPIEETTLQTDPSQDLTQSSENPVASEENPASTKDIDETIPTNVASEPEQEQQPAVEDVFSWAPTTKKSKKDKKRKSKTQDDFGTSSGIATPADAISTPPPSQDLVEATEVPVVSDDLTTTTRDAGELGQEEVSMIPTSEPEQVAEQEPAPEDDFSWPSTKKSKKDKKKRKSKLQDDFDAGSGTTTPTQEESSVPSVAVDVASEEPTPPAQESLDSNILTEEPQQLSAEPEPAMDEPSDFFVSKKSKKDKKKKKPMSIDFGALEETPADSSEMTESSTPAILPQEEPSTSTAEQPKDDDFSSLATTKKSKKDKKKKRASVTWAEPETESGSQTPAVQELPEASKAIEDIVIPADVSEEKTDIQGPSTSTDSLSKPELDSKVDDGDDTLIVAGGVVPDQSDQSISKSELEAKVDDGDDTIIVAGGSLPEQQETSPTQLEPTSSEQDVLPSSTSPMVEPISIAPDETKSSDDDKMPKDLTSPTNLEGEASIAPSEPVSSMTEEPRSMDVTPLPVEEQQPDEAADFFVTKKSKKDKKKKRASQVQFEPEPEPSSLPETPLDTSSPPSVDQNDSKALAADEPIQDVSGVAAEGYFEPLPSKKSKKDKKKAKKLSQITLDSEPSPSSTQDDFHTPVTQEPELPTSESREITEDAPEVSDSQAPPEMTADIEPSQPKDTEEELFPPTRTLSKKDKKKAKKLAQQSWDDVEPPVVEEQKDNSANDEPATQDQPQEPLVVESQELPSGEQQEQQHDDMALEQEASVAKDADADIFPSVTRKMSKKEKKKAQKLAQQSWDEPEPTSPDTQDTQPGEVGLATEDQPSDKTEGELVETPHQESVTEIVPEIKETVVKEPEEEFQPTLGRKMSKKEKRKAQKLAQFTDDTEPVVDDTQDSANLETPVESLQTEDMQPAIPEVQELAPSQETSQDIEDSVSKEPENDEFAPITRKMSKKEKRKAQKFALSAPEAETSESQALDKPLNDSETFTEQTPVEETLPQVSESTDTQTQQDTMDTVLEPQNQDDQPQDDEFPIVTKKMSKKDKKKAKKQAQTSWEPEVTPAEEQEQVAIEPSTIPVDNDSQNTSAIASERDIEQHVAPEPQNQESEEPATEEWPTMTRKLSKKDKKKAKKQAQSWQDTEAESSNLAEPIQSEDQVTQELAQEVMDTQLEIPGPKELDNTPEVPEKVETPVAKEADADDFGFSLSRKKSKKDKKRKGSKQSDSEPASRAQTPAIQDPTLPSVAEAVDSTPTSLDAGEKQPDRGLDTIASENTAEPTDVFPEVTKKSKKDKKRRKSSALVADQIEDNSPANESAEQASKSEKQQDAITTTASPDIWDNDDYFKPRDSDEKDVPPAEPPFEHVEIHPAVARELGASPDKGIGAASSERPLVGLGLIARHSSIFNENEGHAPKLLTMTSDTPSTEARDTPRFQSPDIIPHTERLEASILSSAGGVDLTPAQERSSISHEPPFDFSGPDKRVKTTEADDVSILEQQQQASSLTSIPTSHDAGLSPREIAAEYLEKGHESSPSHHKFLDRQSPKPLSGNEAGSSKDEAASAREIAALYLEHEHDLKKADTARAPSPEDENSKTDVAASAGALTGGVALLAQKFGGAKKTKGKKKGKSKYVDKRAPQEDDMFDDPSLWEGADRKPMEGSRMDADTATFWDVTSENTPAEKPHDSVDGKEARSEQGAVTKAREILDDSEVVESPILGRGIDEGAMIVDRAISPSREVKSGIDIDRASTNSPPGGVAMDLDKHEEKEVRTLPTPRSPSPPPHQHESVIEEPVLRSIEPADDVPVTAFTPTIEFGRSLSRGLPPVQEEPTEEVEAERHDTSLREQPRRLLATPDINRDSGFIADSPIPRQRSYHEDGQIRDSGVHLRDFPESSPRHSTRGFSPEPTKLSRSSADVSHQDTPKSDEKKSKKAHLGESESRRQFREGTPVLREPLEQPHTPEPRKTSTDKQPRSKPKYPDLSNPASSGGAALAAGAAAVSAQRSISDNISASQRASPQPPNFPRRSASNTSISRMRTPEPLNLRPDSPGIIRHSATPPLRSKRVSGDLRSLSQRSQTDLALSAPTSKPSTPAGEAPDLTRAAQNNTPVANEGRVRAKDMTDVYDGFGEGRIGSPRSPTRPHSMRRRQSMQVLELESRVEQLIAENRLLSDARAQAEQHLSSRATSVLAERDAEIDTLKQSIDFLRKEVQRLTEVNEGLSSANATIAIQHNDRYRQLENQHADAARELEQVRSAHGNFSKLLQEKDAEIDSLRAELESTKEKIRDMQRQILEQNPVDADFLNIKDVDHFDHRCQQLCSHVQQWVLRFSKFSDMRACRLTNEINDEKIIDRLDNAVLDGSDVDHYLNDRVKRRDIFMSMTMTMVWEFVFTRYLFGMDREQRQKLKSLEKLLLEVGPPQAVRQWRAVTLTLLSRRGAFKDQRDQDTEAVVQAIFQTLSMILPPPSNLEDQIQTQLRRVMREAVDLAIEMRTQKAEYMMLPPLQPEYDANGDLAETVHFNASLMNERSGDNVINEELEASGSIVRVVLFPLVVKKGDDNGVGDDEIVVCPAQVLIAKPSSSRRSIRMVTPSSDAGGVSLLRGGSPSTAPNRSNVSMAQPEAEYLEGGI